MGKCSMGSLKRIFKIRDIRLTTKIMIVQTLVYPIILYGAETWTIIKVYRKTIDAFELWCLRKLLGVTYLGRKTNTEIIENLRIVGVDNGWLEDWRIVKFED